VSRGGVVLLGLVLPLAPACGEAPDFRPRAGGDGTVDDRSSNAFSFPLPGLSPEDFERHARGDAAFEATFVTAPAPVNPGLGPRYNNTACGACHLRDGRGMPVLGAGPRRSHLLVRVSLAEGEPVAPGGAVPVPGLGVQLQDQAILGELPEVSIEIDWQAVPGVYGDGDPYELRRPDMTITLADGSPLGVEVQRSLRQPPPVFGLGLLEAVTDATLEALADPDDDDGDGISGRPNVVWDPERGATDVGRFGHKGSAPDLDVQTAAAYANDMGVGNPLFVDESGALDLDEDTMRDAAFYARTLAVPARTAIDDAEVEAGEARFRDFGCAGCHVEQLTTGASPIATLADQVIQPYTDLLLHDLGEALADHRPDFAADGREWRTPALWGVGLTHTVLPLSGFLHDGRARDLAEAILWHGGEAEPAREAFRLADRTDRAALLAFLASL
jgi:CxxC motif-containing protein (DUF1111 family)